MVPSLNRRTAQIRSHRIDINITPNLTCSSNTFGGCTPSDNAASSVEQSVRWRAMYLHCTLDNVLLFLWGSSLSLAGYPKDDEITAKHA